MNMQAEHLDKITTPTHANAWTQAHTHTRAHSVFNVEDITQSSLK